MPRGDGAGSTVGAAATQSLVRAVGGDGAVSRYVTFVADGVARLLRPVLCSEKSQVDFVIELLCSSFPCNAAASSYLPLADSIVRQNRFRLVRAIPTLLDFCCQRNNL